MGWAIALHGGAGDIPTNLPPERRVPREDCLRNCLQLGVEALKANMPAMDVVELVVCELENHPHFNAGRGSVLTTAGTVEMEASIMDGNKNCGVVSGLSTVLNPISLARLVMDKTPHIYLGFDGAEAFAREQGIIAQHSCSETPQQNGMVERKSLHLLDTVRTFLIESFVHPRLRVEVMYTAVYLINRLPSKGVQTVEASHFITPENIERLKQAKAANRVQVDYTQPISNDGKKDTLTDDDGTQHGTVGCVAVDSQGNVASATSTGGLVNKMVGRIGDTPIIGAGTYANNLCAVSATGIGEDIIRATVARDVAALMEYKGLSLREAADYVVECVPRGSVGLVAVSATGEVAMPFNSTGMFRACATEDGFSEVAIWPSKQS